MAMTMTEPVQILIVEDEPLIAMMLEDFLDVLDKQVAGTVDSVEDALARVAEGGIDAAILDVNLRGGQKSTPVAEALAERPDADVYFVEYRRESELHAEPGELVIRMERVGEVVPDEQPDATVGEGG